ncbi:hypothetical protein ACI2LF_10255 [Kribbella sp. NPDC020789]
MARYERKPIQMGDPESARKADELDWQDLKEGDRVQHFDYGSGTVRAAGMPGIRITWDDPSSARATADGIHSREFASFLRRLDPDAAGPRNSGLTADAEQPTKRTARRPSEPTIA